MANYTKIAELNFSVNLIPENLFLERKLYIHSLYMEVELGRTHQVNLVSLAGSRLTEETSL